MTPAPVPSDLLPLDDLAAKLRLSPKTLKRLGKEGLPLFRLLPNGALFAYWSDVDRWIRQRKAQMEKRCQSPL